MDKEKLQFIGAYVFLATASQIIGCWSEECRPAMHTVSYDISVCSEENESLPPGSYRVVASLDDQVETEEFTIDTDGQLHASSGARHFDESELDDGCVDYGLFSSLGCYEQYQSFSQTVYLDDALVGEQHIELEYDQPHYPSGEGCGECWEATDTTTPEPVIVSP